MKIEIYKLFRRDNIIGYKYMKCEINDLVSYRIIDNIKMIDGRLNPITHYLILITYYLTV